MVYKISVFFISLIFLFSNINAISGSMATSYNEHYVVNSKEGLNIRDSDCSIVDTLTYKSIASVDLVDNDIKSCSIDGVDEGMVNINYPGYQEYLYIASKYVSKLYDNEKVDGAVFYTNKDVILRGEDCKPRIMAGSNSEINVVSDFNTIHCIKDGQIKAFTEVSILGQTGYIDGSDFAVTCSYSAINVNPPIGKEINNKCFDNLNIERI